jgi:hypothetical protein
MSKFINPESNIHLICMAESGSKKFLKIPSEPSETVKNNLRRDDSNNLRTDYISSLRNSSHRFDRPEKSEKPLNLPRSFSSCGSQKGRIVGGVPTRSNLNHFSARPLKSSKIELERLAGRSSTFTDKKISSPRIVTADLVKKEHLASRFLSVLTDTGRIIRSKTIHQPPGRKDTYRTNTTQHLSQIKRLQMFQAVRKQPLPFLDLHVGFGASKQTVRSLVKRGLLNEMWGPQAVGLRFKLSKKGQDHLKELEAASKYDSRTSNRGVIRLKSRSF